MKNPFPQQVPYNLEIEQGIIGTLLINNEAYRKVAEFLRVEYFYELLHQKMYREISNSLDTRLQSIDPQTILLYLKQEEYGDRNIEDYIKSLASSIVTPLHIVEYAKHLYNLYLCRQLVEIGETMIFHASQGLAADQTPENQIEVVEQRLFMLGSSQQEDFIPLSDACKRVVKHVGLAMRRYKEGYSVVTGIGSGFRRLDNFLGGFQRSDLIIIAGRPSMGKTALATNIAYNAAKAHVDHEKEGIGTSVGFFSLEMSADQIALRLLSEKSRIPSKKIRQGSIGMWQYEQILECGRLLCQLPLHIDQTAALSIAALRHRARYLKRTRNIGLIIVDYLQLLQDDRYKQRQNRVQELSDITSSLKGLAKELNVPVIALSQLNRTVELRENKRPQLADLRDSGSIEQDADIVIFVYREAYYFEREKPIKRAQEQESAFQERYTKWEQVLEKIRYKSELIISKHRNGATGVVPMHFEQEFTHFSDTETYYGQEEEDESES